MDRPPPTIPGTQPPASCSEGCPFAEPLHGDYEDWVWCRHPAASGRVRQVGRRCPVFQRAQLGWFAAAPVDSDPFA